MKNKIKVLISFPWKGEDYVAGSEIRIKSDKFSDSDFQVLAEMGNVEPLPVTKKVTKKKETPSNAKDED